MLNEKLIICSCGSAEHSIILRYNKEDDEIYFEPTLKRLPFLTRLKLAAKYILNQDGGMFAEIILDREGTTELEIWLNKVGIIRAAQVTKKTTT